MKIAVLDFETHYSEDYTLKKMTVEAYVRDPRFKTLCVGAKPMHALPPANENPAIETHVMDGPTFAQVARAVPEYALVCHNANFDGLILSHHYGVQPAFYFDTLSMARLIFPHDKSHSLESLAAKFNLPAKNVPYNEFIGLRELPPEIYGRLSAGCAHDVELTYIIFRKMLPLVPRQELRIIDATVRMFTEPTLHLDYAQMERYYEKVKAEKTDILERLGVSKEDLHSSAKFAEILKSLGVEPPTKPSPKDPNKVIYAFAKTDDEMKELCDADDERVSALCNARLGQKSTLNETRCARLLRMYERGPLAVALKYYGAPGGGRHSGDDKLNFQNFPRSGEIRRCIRARPGYVLLVGDLSQIECRLLNWQAGERRILQAFREGRDLYSEIASEFYGRPITKADAAERGVGKQVELSAGYGSGGNKICITARRGTYGPPVILTEAEGKAWAEHYRRSHPNVVNLWAQGEAALRCLYVGTEMQLGALHVKEHKIYDPVGAWLDYRCLVYKGVDKWGKPDFAVARRQGESRIYGSKFIQNTIEFLARRVLWDAAMEFHKYYRVRLMTHDEAVFEVPEKEAEEAKTHYYNLLTTAPSWCPDLPLQAEVSYNVCYNK